jgi:uncharacterized protein YegL
MTRSDSRRFIACFALVALTVACGRSSTDAVGSVFVVSGLVSAADGGTVEVTAADAPELAGTRIAIPPGALDRDTTITITHAVRDIEIAGSNAGGPPIEIGPTGTTFNLAAEVTIPLTAAPERGLERLHVRRAGGVDLRFPSDISFDPETRQMTFEVTELADFQGGWAANSCGGVICAAGDVCRNGGCFAPCDEVSPQLFVVLVLDRSNSMAGTDPNNQTLVAAQDVVESYVANPTTTELLPDVAFAVIGFGGTATVHTRDASDAPGFSKDGADVLDAIAEATPLSANTYTASALIAADDLIRDSLAGMSEADRARAKYEVILLSDGMPFPENCTGETNAVSMSVGQVASMRAATEFEGADFTLSTAFFSDPDMFTADMAQNDACCYGVDQPPLDLVADCNVDRVTLGQATRETLSRIAEAGGGTALQFDGITPVDFLSYDLDEPVSSSCPYSYSCQAAHNLCVPAACEGPSCQETCTTDTNCGFGTICVGGTCHAAQTSAPPAPDSTDTIKVVFLVDRSSSMQFTDPGRDRFGAVMAAMSAIQADYSNARFHVSAYDLGMMSSAELGACERFSADVSATATAMTRMMPAGDGLGDMQAALETVSVLIENDLAGVGCATAPTASELADTHYAVVIVSDGMRAPCCNFGFGNDFDLANPTQPDKLCESADFINCLLKVGCGEPDGADCSGGMCTYGDATCYDQVGDSTNPCAPPDILGNALGSDLKAGGAYNQAYQLGDLTANIAALGATTGAASVRVHTALVLDASADPVTIDLFRDPAVAASLMTDLAEIGGGNALACDAPATLDLTQLGIVP